MSVENHPSGESEPSIQEQITGISNQIDRRIDYLKQLTGGSLR